MTDTAAQTEFETTHQQRSAVAVARWLILGGLLVIVFWLAVKVWRVVSATQSLLNIQHQAETLQSGNLTDIDLDEAQRLVLQTRQDVLVLKNELSFVRPVVPHLASLPTVGPLLADAPHLLDMADAGTEAAVYLLTLRPGLEALQTESTGSLALGDLLEAITDNQEELRTAAGALERVAAARAQITNTERLPFRVQSLLAQVDGLLSLAQAGSRLLPVLPELLGHDGTRRYLILAQNEDELRPTGGFISGAGLLEVADGDIVSITFDDANVVDNFKEKPYDFPPQPFYDFMRLELFLLRDANYWPDFPTSAQKAMDLYSYGQNVGPLDGVIAIDQQFLRLLVEATGPIPVRGTDTTIRPGNVINLLRDARGIEEGQAVGDWVHNRKAFMEAFSIAFQDKIQNDFGSLNPITLAHALYQAIEDRHLQIYMTDPEVATELDAIDWDGRLPQAPLGDFLMVVDTNMGYNKSNVYVQRSTNYRVFLDGATPNAELTVHYSHTGPDKDKPCYQGTAEEYAQSLPYLASAEKCYWNYLRVYAPAGSDLFESSRHVVPGESLFSGETWNSTAEPVNEMPGLSTFANFLLVANGRSESSTFTYRLPDAVLQPEEEGHTVRYRLQVFKQAGTGAEPFSLAVTLPATADPVNISPQPARVERDTIYFEKVLTANTEFIIDFRRP